MDYNELPELKTALESAAMTVGRTITEDEVKIFYDYLRDLPIRVIKKAIKEAILSRPPDDEYLKRALITVPEIQAAAEDIMRDEGDGSKRGVVKSCHVCEGSGWLTREADGRLVAWPCECLYKAAKEALARKKRPGSHETDMDYYRYKIVKAYEVHQQKWRGIENETSRSEVGREASGDEESEHENQKIV